ncbi:MAG: PHP domain-containing protein, partial [Chloroflexota bacterium]
VSSQWKDQMVDFLCFGFNPEENALLALTEEIKQAQQDNTTQVITSLRASGYAITDEDLANTLASPSSQHLNELIALVEKYQTDDAPLGRVLGQAGFRFASIEPSRIVAAAHASDALCILAHPGRDDGFMCFDTTLLDELRAEAPIDGIEAYYPKHTDEHTQQYLAYATEHNLLVSSGSDSHNAEKLPIKYKAEYSRQLLERLGIQFA